MSSKYKVGEDAIAHFVTLSVVIKHSSANDYYTNEHGLLKIEHLGY